MMGAAEPGGNNLTFLTTIIATLFGGILAVGTSVFLRQWELRQTTRIRMYDELLPQLAREYFRWRDMHKDVSAAEVSDEIFDSVTKLYRAAKISVTGKRSL